MWTLLGAAVFPLGVALAAVVMQRPALARAAPVAVGLVVVLAGALQFTAWKARQLACCRSAPMRPLSVNAATAWQYGLRLGVYCVRCCASMTAILLVIGVMDLRVMALVTAAISLERLAPAGERVARVIGAVVIAVGAILLGNGA